MVDRGVQRLKGIEGGWQLYAVAGPRVAVTVAAVDLDHVA
jgi:hypothetical protein